MPEDSDPCKVASAKVGQIAEGKSEGSANRRPSWIRRHPVWTGVLAFLAGGLGAAGYFAPIYPTDYHRDNSLEAGPLRIDLPGQSAGFNQVARWMDARHYMGSPELNARQYNSVMALQTYPGLERPKLELTDFTPSNSRSERNKQLSQASDSQLALYDRIAEYFAGTIFQDANWYEVADTTGTPFADKVPYKDLPLSVFFDGDKDVRNNAQSLLQWVQGRADAPVDLTPSVYQRVRESETHYFVEYILYYPFNDFSEARYSVELFGAFPDPNSFTHEQDIEHQMIFIRKTADGQGQFDGLLTFRHGYADIYHLDPSIQKRMRENLGGNLASPMDVLKISMGPLYQPHAIRHGKSAKDTFVFDSTNSSVVTGINLYSARMGHAFMGIDLDAFVKGYGDVAVLIPSARLDQMNDGSNLNSDRIFPYQLLSWNDLLQEYGRDPQVFEGSISREKIETKEGTLQIRARQPESIVRGLGDTEARTVLPTATSGRAPDAMAFPHAVLEFLSQGIEGIGPISDVYIFNPDVQLVD